MAGVMIAAGTLLSASTLDADLQAMGFPAARAAEAALRHSRTEEAVDWLLARCSAEQPDRVSGNAFAQDRENRGSALSDDQGLAISKAGSCSMPIPRPKRRLEVVDLDGPSDGVGDEACARRRVRGKQTQFTTFVPGSSTGSTSMAPCSVGSIAASSSQTAPVSTPGDASASVAAPVAAWNETSQSCAICCEDQDLFRCVRLPCAHGWYCAPCMQRLAQACLDEGGHKVKCPECRVPLDDVLLPAFLSKHLIDRLLARSLEHAVMSCGDLWPCPTPDCPNRVALEEGQCPRFQCDLCSREHCLRCHVTPYHSDVSCEQHAAAMASASNGSRSSGVSDGASDGVAELLAWMKRTGSRQCPKCKMVITKHDMRGQQTDRAECHKMICRNCTTRFCFRCSAILTSTSTCGCTGDDHGFIDPTTGQFKQHLAPRQPPPGVRGHAKRLRR